MGQIQEVKTLRIGVDVWWDHKLQKFRTKRINLNKCSIDYRCPNCGKILAKPRDRDRRFNFAQVDLNWWGGVCRECWLDGFGKNGGFGTFMKRQLEKDKEKYENNENKVSLWINDELRLVDKDKVIYI